MKTGLFILIGLLFGQMAFSQDLLGFQAPEIQKTTKGVKGIQLQLSGDSVIEVKNPNSERFFKFKIDPTTRICYQEDIKITSWDYENLHILDRFMNIKTHSKPGEEKVDSTYQTSFKTIQIIHEGDNIHLIYKLKVSPSAFLAIRNGDENY